MGHLQRFVDAQHDMYQRALNEIRAGKKQSHWIWFVFPQLAGLGHSQTSQRYAISSLGEAREYLAHPLLGHRLTESVQAMLDWAGKRSAVAILGPTDAVKFGSSMTLFEIAALEQGGNDRFGHALNAFCQGRRDGQTLRLLRLARDGPVR